MFVHVKSHHELLCFPTLNKTSEANTASEMNNNMLSLFDNVNVISLLLSPHSKFDTSKSDKYILNNKVFAINIPQAKPLHIKVLAILPGTRN